MGYYCKLPGFHFCFSCNDFGPFFLLFNKVLRPFIVSSNDYVTTLKILGCNYLAGFGGARSID
jgi:hypothetical protein